MSSIWLTSDTHFGHSNIVKASSQWENKSECRDFKSLEYHDSHILDNINSVVKEDDYLYHLGDFCFGGRDNIYKYRSRIVCKNIYLIYGNHDLIIRNRNPILDTGSGFINAQNLFTWCGDVLEKKIGDTNLFMSHYSHRTWHKAARGSIHLFGHSHNSLDWQQWGKSMDVCISGNNYFPYHIDDIRKIMAERQVLLLDHHKTK